MIGQSPYGGALAAGTAPAAPAAPAASCTLRPPTREQLTYTRELLTVVLLLCAFPWLLGKLLTDPGKVLGGGAITKSV